MVAMWTALLHELKLGVVISHPHASRAGDVLTLTGGLHQTMHMARATLDLGTWALRLVDEDHRDGGDHVVRRRGARGAAAWRARVARVVRAPTGRVPKGRAA